jgi:mRNA-degrading endonuclease toxin of MazEF toxin-antitoxin module
VIERGDVRWFRFSAPDKRRPVLVLGRADVLPSLSQIPVIGRLQDGRWPEVRAALLEVLGLEA